MKMSALEKRFVNGAHHSRNVADALVRRLQRLPVRPGQRLLEVGCGNGAAALAVADELGLDVTAVDVDPDQIALARRSAGARGQVCWRVADAAMLPFDDALFDGVVTHKTLHHISDWRRALTECVRVLRGGGFLLVADIVLPSCGARVAERLLGRHLATAEEMQAVAAGLGLELVSFSSVGAQCAAIWRRS
jgi:ubiquinone/menaquinone biosynthesis C-methylase UbiE